MTSSLVWFQLLDSATGQPYKGTSVTCIIRSSLVVPVVDLFRKAVKAEHSNKLSSFDAADLLVYKNKAAFNKRNAAVDDGKEEPLKSSCALDGLGGSEEEALVVVVPSSARSSFIGDGMGIGSSPTSIRSSFNTKIDGIALNDEHLKRNELVHM